MSQLRLGGETSRLLLIQAVAEDQGGMNGPL